MYFLALYKFYRKGVCVNKLLQYNCLSFSLKQILKEEITVMKDKIEHHPDVTRFAMENLELRGNY